MCSSDQQDTDKDLVALKCVQRMPGMEQFTYEETLEKLGLFSLEQRKLRGENLIEIYKVESDIHRINCSKLSPMEKGERWIK